MKFKNFFKDMFESIPDYRKIVLIISLFKNDKKFLQECGFLYSDNDSLNKEFKIFLTEQNEKYLSYIKKRRRFINGEVF